MVRIFCFKNKKGGVKLGTSLSEVVDLFMTRVNDYRLNTVYQTSGSFIFTQYVEPWVLDSIGDFEVCTQSLAYTPTSGSVEGYFTEDLTTEHKSILSRLMLKYWMNKTVQDVLQMNNAITDHDYKTFSQAQNLKAKQDYYNSLKEELSQVLVDYAYKNNSWSEWRSQTFYT